MASVTIVFRKDKINKKGESPIHFRIIKKRKVSYIASGIHISDSLWDHKRSKIKSGHRNSARLNSYLTNKFAEIQDTVFEHETISMSLTSKNLKDKVFGKSEVNFFDFASNVVERYKHNGQIGTYHKCKSILSKLKEFRTSCSLTFNEITLEFLLAYEDHCRVKSKNKINTINKDMKFIRKVFNDAIRQDLIEREFTPFGKYKMRQEKTQRFFLTEDELSWIEKYPAKPKSKIELHRDMFLFAACTGGLRISDILRLQWKDFDETHLNITIKKTGEQLSIKVPNKGLAIINKYKPEIQKDNLSIFPILPEKLNQDDPEKLDTAISNATAHVNKNLKIIAGAVGIKKILAFILVAIHLQLGLRKGISIDKVSKLMAHSAIRETQIYAKVVNSELDNAMDVFN